jgi:hypothetical protein
MHCRVDDKAEVLRGPMSKPFPVFKFAFIAYALTRSAHAGGARSSATLAARRAAVGGSETTTGAEADRFIAAWDLAAFDKRGFSVCVRASKLAKAPGFSLLADEERRPSTFEYVWLCDIEEMSIGFVGRPREPLSGLGDALYDKQIAFGLANIAHWAFAPPVFAGPKAQVEPMLSALMQDCAGAPSKIL